MRRDYSVKVTGADVSLFTINAEPDDQMLKTVMISLAQHIDYIDSDREYDILFDGVKIATVNQYFIMCVLADML